MDKPPLPLQLLTVAEAARLKNVSRSAIYKAIAQGRLAHELVLGHVALHETEVLNWIPYQNGRRRGSTISDEAKQKISEGQKKRWARVKGDPPT